MAVVHILHSPQEGTVQAQEQVVLHGRNIRGGGAHIVRLDVPVHDTLRVAVVERLH